MDPVLELFQQLLGNLQGEAGLAHASGPNQRKEAHVRLCEQMAGRLHFLLTPYEPAEPGRQVVWCLRPSRRPRGR